ncbi:MAG: DUF434 domain-containing protein [Sedimentisphaerales bacterium]|nr:DUF434 domain-containing protein [Sedimentisphaerales bacterium]
MPDKRAHRGPHPADAELFAPEALPRLREALADFSLLLTKGYADKSALKLVGDRFSLTQRQRLAVMRSACSDQQLQSRLARRVDIADIAGQSLAIDGYNLLITIEAALSGGLIFRGRDGCLRDLASIHGTYRKVEETVPALTLIGKFLADIDVGLPRGEGVPPSNHRQACTERSRSDARDTTTAEALWLLDSPVSNSGRLKTLIANLAREHDWNWEARLSLNPDAELRQTDQIVVTTDSVILDTCPHWTNLADAIITRSLADTTIVDLA